MIQRVELRGESKSFFDGKWAGIKKGWFVTEQKNPNNFELRCEFEFEFWVGVWVGVGSLSLKFELELELEVKVELEFKVRVWVWVHAVESLLQIKFETHHSLLTMIHSAFLDYHTHANKIFD